MERVRSTLKKGIKRREIDKQNFLGEEKESIDW